jgi:hypothetical protein
MRNGRIQSSELEYVCSQRDLTLAKRKLRTLKIAKEPNEEAIKKAKEVLEKAKVRAEKASAALAAAGLSKAGI